MPVGRTDARNPTARPGKYSLDDNITPDDDRPSSSLRVFFLLGRDPIALCIGIGTAPLGVGKD